MQKCYGNECSAERMAEFYLFRQGEIAWKDKAAIPPEMVGGGEHELGQIS